MAAKLTGLTRSSRSSLILLAQNSKKSSATYDSNGEKNIYRLVRKSEDSDTEVHFEARVTSGKRKIRLSCEKDDIDIIKKALDLNGNGKISRQELAKYSVIRVSSSPLLENHSRDSDVTAMFPSDNVFFEYTPKTLPFAKWPKPGTLEFDNDIVKIGITDSGDVISFMCPQDSLELRNSVLDAELKSEVEVGEVGGYVDTVTGEGVIYGDDLSWKFWGNAVIGGQSFSISKEDAAFIPIRSDNGSGGLLVLRSIDKSANGVSDANDIFGSYYVSGLQGNPAGAQKGLIQELLIQAINVELPGFANGDTRLQWNIHLASPVSIGGSDYIDIAHSRDMF